jgi:hypothetical protein
MTSVITCPVDGGNQRPSIEGVRDSVVVPSSTHHRTSLWSSVRSTRGSSTAASYGSPSGPLRRCIGAGDKAVAG